MKCICGYEQESPFQNYVSDEPVSWDSNVCCLILDWAGKEGLDMDAIIREKMEYNRTRPYRHGGKVL